MTTHRYESPTLSIAEWGNPACELTQGEQTIIIRDINDAYALFKSMERFIDSIPDQFKCWV